MTIVLGVAVGNAARRREPTLSQPELPTGGFAPLVRQQQHRQHSGTYRPSRLGKNNFLVEIPAREHPAANRLYPGQYIIDEGQIGPPANGFRIMVQIHVGPRIEFSRASTRRAAALRS